ncbi:MAG: tetratricopeptide repeat protein [Bacteroidota bacterium]
MNSLLRVALLWLVTISLVQAQAPDLDSLRGVFGNPNFHDTSRFEAGRSLVMARFRSNLDTARIAGQKLLDFAREAQNLKWQATAHRLIGNTYAVQGLFIEAREAFFASHNILLELGDEEGLTTTYNNIGTVFYELGNYTLAQEYLLKSLKLAESQENDITASRALNNLGNIHHDLFENEAALGYYRRSLEIRERLGQKSRLPAAYNNIGLIHGNMGQRQLAMESLQKSAEIASELGDLKGESRAIMNLGIEYAKEEDFNRAHAYFDRSIKVKTGLNDRDGLSKAYLFKGQAYLQTKNYRLALANCARSLEMSQASGALNWEKESYLCLSRAEEGLGQYRSSLEHRKEYEALSDTIFNEEKAKEMTRAEVTYAFEKQQLADSIAFQKQQSAQQVAYERQLNGEQRKFYVTLIASLLLVAFMGFLYWRYQQNLKVKNLENELLNSEIDFKKKDLTNLAVNISSNQEWAESLAERVAALKDSTGRQRAKELEDLEVAVRNKVWVDKESDEFYKQIDELSSSFYHQLNTRFEGLTKTEIRLCSLIRLDLNTKQIAVLQNIEPSSVKMSRNRLRKKLQLTPEEDLSSFLHAI